MTKKVVVIVWVVLVMMMVGCGGGGNSGGGTTPILPPPTPTITPLTVTFTPIAPGIEQASQLPSGSLFVGQQAKVSVTQNGTAVSGATLTVSLGTLSQTTYTAPDTSGSVTISAKGTDGATGSATVNVVKPTAPTAVATIDSGMATVLRRKMFFTDDKNILAAALRADNQTGPHSLIVSLDTASQQLKKT